MTDRLAVVTGGSAGIGWSIAQRLAADGYRVAAFDIVEGRTAESSDVDWHRVDIRDPRIVDQAFDDLVARHGAIDVLVNNAGVQLHRSLENLTFAEWTSVVDVNLHGTFLCLQAAGRHMLDAGGGAIVNIASISARGQATRAPYATTKAAIVGLTATAGAEWAARGVRVNAVAPGYVDTGVYREGVASGRLDPEVILSRIPSRRLADPQEIASVVAFLASDAASYITGQTLYVDGGFVVDFGIPAREQ